MLKAGLTGNIGSGKTVVSRIFTLLGVPVYHADEAAKAFLRKPPVRDEIILHFGPEILGRDREIDRKNLASLVFRDPDALVKLNSILHPKVRDDFREWSARLSDHPYVIQEAAIIYESGFSSEFDYIINVSCPKETAIERVTERDGAGRYEVMLRMSHQMDDGEKSRRADFVVRNDGSELVIPQVLAIHRILSESKTG